jgi:transcriptional regulator with XRE-family HTH domain
MSLGERIRELRQAKKFTQRQLAEIAGIDYTYLSKIENDRLEHSPSLKTLKVLAEILGADELDLLDLADKMPPVLRDIADNPEALQFFRRASKVSKSPKFWRSLTSQLDQIEKEVQKADATPEADEQASNERVEP